MGVVAKVLKLPPLPLLDCNWFSGESQAFYPKKNGDFFASAEQNKINPIIGSNKNKPNKYVTFMFCCFSLTVLFFQIPLILFVSLEKNIISGDFLSRSRIWFLLLFFLGASLLSPPDWRSQLILALSFFIFFELAVWFAFLHARRANKRKVFAH